MKSQTRLLPRFSAALLLAALATALLAPAVLARARAVVWRQFDVDMTVQTDGSLSVTETQVIEFQDGPFHVGFASIPLEGSDGVTLVAVGDETRDYQPASGGETPYTYTTFFEDGYLNVEWYFPETFDETRTFHLTYNILGAVRQYDEASGDKIRVMPVGTDFEFPILSSTITVHLPPGADLLDDPDSIGAPMEWQTGLDNRSVTFRSTRSIEPGEGVGLQLVFRHGAISAPKPAWQQEFDQQESYDTTVRPWIDLGLWAVALALAVAAPAVLYLIWYTTGRDPAAALAPAFVTEPPSDLPPGLAGVVIDERADMRDITATLIDLARRGLVTLEEEQVPGAFATTAKRWVLKSTGANADMLPYERMLLNAVLGGAAQATLDKLPARFFAALPAIEKAMYDETVRRGLFRSNPEEARGFYRTLGVILIILGVVGGCGLSLVLSEITFSMICPILPVIGFGLGLAILSNAMPARTRKGAEEAARWRAFQTYLGNMQKYKDVAGAVDQFERYLPYAIAFGLERRWVNAFAQAPATVFVPIPGWYRPIGRPLASYPGSAGQTPGGAGVPGLPGGQVPGLNQIGEGLTGGLNSIGDSFVNALNAAGRSLSTPPAPTYTYSGGGSRGFSGGRSTFRSGGGFRSGGFSGGGRRGFR
jgi:hypothetical protein